ncbi:MAG TPA: O-antigen ligase family protein [Pyrinomonadaceae bacterium]|nr:O-antigen ligase family protein [Pyrinomonadaceae bacterium]
MFNTAARSGGEAIRADLRAHQLGLTHERVIFSSLLLVIGLAAVPFGSVEPWWEGIFESAIFLLGACFLITSMIDRQYQIENVSAPLIALIVFAVLQTVPFWSGNPSPELLAGQSQTISVDPFETRRFAIKLLALSLTLIMLLRYVSTRRRLLLLADVVIIVGAASAAFAIWRKVSPTTWLALLGNNKLQGESFGQFMNRNHFAVLMEMAFGVALGLASYSGLRLRRYLYSAVALGLCIALIMANSRGGIISMLGQVGFLAWIGFSRVSVQSVDDDARDQRSRRRSFWGRTRLLALRCFLIVVLLGAALSSVFLLGGESVRHRLESVPSEFRAQRVEVENQSPRRLEIWTSTLRLIEAHPLVGSGFGAYQTAIMKYFEAGSDWRPQQAHNDYLEFASGGGIVGAVLGIWLVLYLIRNVNACLLNADAFRRAVCFGALIGLVGVAVHSLVDFGLHVMANALICCGLVALAIAKPQITWQ